MKEVKYYSGIPRWTSGKLIAMIAVQQRDGSYKDEIISNIQSNDPWSGQISTEDTVYVWKPKEQT